MSSHRVSNELGTFEFTSRPDGEVIRTVIAHEPSPAFVEFQRRMMAHVVAQGVRLGHLPAVEPYVIAGFPAAPSAAS